MARDIDAPLIRTLKSLKLTVILMLCLTAIFIIGLIVPQKAILGKEMYTEWKAQRPLLLSVLELLRFTDIYVAPITLAIWGVFFLNLAMVMAGRIPNIWRRCTSIEVPRGGPRPLKSLRHYKAIEAASINEAAAALGAMKFKVFSDEGSFRAVRNRFSPLATLLFHLSFILLLAGGLMTFYTKFRASADVAVGETFIGNYKDIHRPKVGDIPRTTFTVESVKPTYYDNDIPVDLEVVLRTPDGLRSIGINRPYKKGALSFIINSIDVAPVFVMRDESGTVVDRGFFKLRVLNGTEGLFEMRGYEFRTFFYADYKKGFAAMKEDPTLGPQMLKQTPPLTQRKQQREIVNPAFYVAVFKGREFLGTKTLALNESIEFDGLSLEFSDWVYWVNFLAGHERGLWVVYAGFLLMTLALIIRFVFYRRDIMCVSEDGMLHLAGRSEYFPALFADEFEKLVGRIGEGKP